MPRIDRVIHREVTTVETPRLAQMSGIFDLPPDLKSVQDWNISIDLPEKWSIGAIVGPSGCGKSTIAREIFGDRLVSGWDWPANKCILDGFPASMGIKEIAGLLSSVGFSSPPTWRRPFSVLSNGQQFRVTLARTLAECPDLAVVDEFTSVVDRTIAQIGSAAVAKAVRRRGGQFVAVSCHYDILDWLEPDWVYGPETNSLRLNVGPDGSRGSLWRRPKIELEIVRVHRSAWQLFKPHHYLSGNLSKSSACYVGFFRGHPVVFTAVLSFPHPTHPSWREHRTVCLPDFQGVGIGNAMSEHIASVYASQKRYTSTTANPAMVRHRCGSSLWQMTRKMGLGMRFSKGSTRTEMEKTKAINRLTAGFRYVGPANPQAAAGFGLGVKLQKSPAVHGREKARLLALIRGTSPTPAKAHSKPPASPAPAFGGSPRR